MLDAKYSFSLRCVEITNHTISGIIEQIVFTAHERSGNMQSPATNSGVSCLFLHIGVLKKYIKVILSVFFIHRGCMKYFNITYFILNVG